MRDPDAAVATRLETYFDRIGAVLANKTRRASFATYAMGLLGDGERKSVEPIAARACADPAAVRPCQQRLGHFLNDAVWDDAAVRRTAARYAITAMTTQAPITTWIVDDTGFIKQGTHSVGVQRQYTGSAGKITNCQVGVSLSVATPHAHVPVDVALYLPASWCDDPARRHEARIPDTVAFQTKWQLAIGMLRQAVADDVPRGVVLADADYGDRVEFRAAVRGLGLDYAVAVRGPTRVWSLDAAQRRRGAPVTVAALATSGTLRFRRMTWRAGTRRAMRSRFAFARVVSAYDDATLDPAVREALWLVVEWPEGEATPTKFALATLPPTTTHRALVNVLKERYRTEQVYAELKGELGFDHFEGRRYPGWHHHVSVALSCYAFVVAERVRRFPPSAARARDATAHAHPAGAPLPGLVSHAAPRARARHRALVTALPVLPSGAPRRSVTASRREHVMSVSAQ